LYNIGFGDSDNEYWINVAKLHNGNVGDALLDHENQIFEFYNNWKGVNKWLDR